MRVSHFGFLAVQALAVSAIRSAGSGSDCRAVGSVISEFSHLGALATEFCSSYLSIPATTTYFATVTETPTSLLTFTLPETTTVADASCAVTAAPNAKKRHVPLPTGLEQYAASVLSSACGRLRLAPTASTTLTGLVSSATTSTVDVAAATATSCMGCIPDNSPCNLYHPEQCCGQTCYCGTGFPNCHCISNV